MKRVTFYFVTGAGLTSQVAWVAEDLNPADLGHADFIYNAEVRSRGVKTGRMTIRMEHVAFWTYD